LVRSAEVWDLANRLGQFGVGVSDPKLFWNQVIDRKESIVKSIEGDKEAALKERDIDLLKGKAVFTSPTAIEVEGKTIEANKFVLALGSKTARPPIEGLEYTITSTEALSLRELPKSMVIIGGGVIAMEFAHIFSSAGVNITMIEMGDRLLSGEDEDSSKVIQEITEKRGIKVHLNTKVNRVVKDGDTRKVEVTGPDGNHKIVGDCVILAAGRVPSVEGVGLDKIGVKVEKTGIVVNEYLQTTVDHIYAGGDGIGGYMLTPVASYEGRVATRNAFKGNHEKVDYSLVTRTTFTHPAIASIGPTEAEAKEQGISYNVSSLNFKDVGPAVILGETDGFVKILSEKESGRIIGAHIVGPHADDLIHQIAIAMKGKLTLKDLAEIISIHPSISEAVVGAAITGVKGHRESCCG
jgi:dihydrolipoamide dehydrogenase